MSTTSTMPPEGPTIKVISHSMLFYWWPVWAVGFVLALLTYLDGNRLAIVPDGTKVRARGGDYELTPPSQQEAAFLQKAVKEAEAGRPSFPLHIAQNKNYGIVFLVVLLLVIFSTNVPLRGLWSLVAILFVVLLTMLLALFDLWGPILDALGQLHIYITAAGYFFTSAVLFVAWVVVVVVFDSRRYMQFSPGQFVVHREVGDMREVYDTNRVTVEKRRSDLFRHWILGLGSGDLVISVPGTVGAQQLELPNVLFAARKVQLIADLMKTRAVIPEKG